jgi:four helix bundle protein
MNIALKETTESKYWIKLLFSTDYLTQSEFDSIMTDCVEIEKILVTIVKKVKDTQFEI